jgi:mono/diheme cytochrome c family protein
MKALWIPGLLAIASALTIGTKTNDRGGQEKVAAVPRLPLRESRTSATDLELSGDVQGAQAYAGKCASYAELFMLPQVTFTVTDDANFPGKAELGGVPLQELMQALHIPEKNTLVAAVCDDGYEAHYSAEYRAAHHPLLVLTINGKAPALVKRSSDAGNYGPYLISHPRFVPGYRILGYSEEAQIPNGVIELRFLKEDEVLSAIRPHGNIAADAPQMQGYKIAEENCFRCHGAGDYGGRKAGITWSALGKIARGRPTFFRAYIRDPRAENDYAEMPGFPEYDDATLGALTDYFQTADAAPGQK